MERIMLVEDDQQIIANISQTLRKWQYEPVVVKDGQAVQLTPTEGAMLQILLRQKGQAVSKREILELLWQGGKYLNENTLNVNVSRLRGKLHQLDLDKQLLTERGVGYRIAD